MSAKKLLTAIPAAAISVWAIQAMAGEVQPGIFQITQGASERIDRFEVCKVIRNARAHPVMVPTNKAQEWSAGTGAFLNNIAQMDRVRVTACATPLVPVLASNDADWWYTDGYTARNAPEPWERMVPHGYA